MAEAETLHLEHVAQDVKELKGDVRRLGEDVAELKGEMRQMTQRVSNVEQLLRQVLAGQEQGSRWLIGLVVGAWLTIMLTVLFKG